MIVSVNGKMPEDPWMVRRYRIDKQPVVMVGNWGVFGSGLYKAVGFFWMRVFCRILSNLGLRVWGVWSCLGFLYLGLRDVESLGFSMFRV